MTNSSLANIFKFLFSLLLFSSFFVLVSSVHASELFSDGFESDNFGLWDLSDPNWDAVSGVANAHEGNYRADGGGGSSAVALTKYLSTEGYSDIVLSFWYRIPLNKYEESDSYFVEYTTDGGSAWNLLREFKKVDETITWTEQILLIPAEASDNPLFGFRFSPNTNAIDEELQIDSVLVTGQEIPLDTDGDGIPDTSDNCPFIFNSDQSDFDDDGIGDTCDSDYDNDGILNEDEISGCEFDPSPVCGAKNEDEDNDGVSENDYCPDTSADVAGSIKLNPNHWRFEGTSWLVGLKGGGQSSSKVFTIQDTRGCSCDQIINNFRKQTGGEFKGHFKFGCSAGLIEEFMEFVW